MDTANRAKSIFIAALEKPAERRDSFVEEASAGDSELRSRVQALLKAHDNPDTFLDEPAAQLDPTVEAFATVPISEAPGTVIGRYKLLEQIGEGGMGVVYMAEQRSPIRRRVAIKIIKSGMDTRQVMMRFEAERQALALMEHANIARVLDGGATEAGRPYFVMELVRGVTITEYCDQNNLAIRSRLELFVQVCRAIQHAHQKGIIHRDLKPSNILVTVNDGVAVPKIIDFGVAKAINQQLTEKTLFTAFAQMVGTPLYMSPEQAEMTSLDVDTRSDIYSLGVLLYELLTGATPFDQRRLREAAFDEMRRIIRDEEPPRPSTRFSSMVDATRTVAAARRQIEPQRLNHLLRGDLDWIVMKSLEKDRTRRYDSANGLAQDIDRYLANEPVEARKPTRLYRLRKFVLRNKLGVIAGTAVAAALLTGTILASIGLIQARRQARVAREQAVRSEQVAQFLQDMLKGVDPSVAAGRDTTLLRDILDKSAARVGNDLKDQPDVEAELLTVIGNTYRSLGLNAQAQMTHREALAIYRQLGAESREIATLLDIIAGELSDMEHNIEAEASERQSLAMRKKLLGPENADVAQSLHFLALIVFREGQEAPVSLKQRKFQEAEGLARDALAMRQKVLGNSNRQVAESLETVAVTVCAQHRLDESEALARQSLAMCKDVAGDDQLAIATRLFSLADVLYEKNEYAEAEADYWSVLEIRRKFFGNVHPDVAIVVHHLARLCAAQNRLPEAEQMYRDALMIWRKTFGDGYIYVRVGMTELAAVLEQEGKKPEAEKLRAEARELIADQAKSSQP
jgi:serine/threonine protein kinase